MKNNKPLLISLIVVVAVFIGLVLVLPKLKSSDSAGSSDSDYSYDLSKYNLTSVLEGSEDSGGIADHVKGDINAPVTIFEYADYQCSGCASMNPYINSLLKEYEGKLRIVYRSFPLTNIHPNAIAAASAAEAAGLQGFWEEYANLLFSNQAEWFYSKGTSRTNIFMSYFTSVAGDAGDLSKFRADMASLDVKKKVYFDKAISESYSLDGTPAFVDEDGKEIDWLSSDGQQTMAETMNVFRNYINKKLEEKGIN